MLKLIRFSSFLLPRRPVTSIFQLKFAINTQNDNFSKDMKTFFSINSPLMNKIQEKNSDFDEKGYITLYLNDSSHVIQESIIRSLKTNFLFMFLSTFIFWQNYLYLMSIPFVLGCFDVKKTYTINKAHKSICQRILINEDKTTNLMKFYFFKNIDREIIVKRENIQIKEFLLGLDKKNIRLLYKSAFDLKGDKLFDINQFQMKFDVIDESGIHYKDLVLIWGDDTCYVEDFNIFMDIFKLKNE